MDRQKAKHQRQLRRQRHVRKKTFGTDDRPRLNVYRSNKHTYVQIIDDSKGVTLAAASTAEESVRGGLPYGGNIKAAVEIGKRIAQAAKEKGVAKVAFDRGHYRYHGRIKALADAARQEGLQF